MRSFLQPTSACLVAFLAFACGDASEPAGTSTDSNQATAGASTPDTDSTDSMADASGQDAAPAGGQAAGGKAPEPKFVAASGGRPAMLDTGIDLSHLKDKAAPADFPAAAGTPGSVGPPAPGPAQAVPTQPAGPPGKLELIDGAEITEFGELLEGEKQDVTFRFKSSGDAPLYIERVKPSCGCTAAEIQLVGADGAMSVYQLGQPIPPGTELEIGATVNTANRRGPFASNVAIYSNDPASPMRLQLKADVKAVLDVSPMNLDLGMMTSGDMKEGTFTISTPVLDPFLLELDEANIIPPLKAELAPIDPDAEGRSKTWELKVTLGPDTPEGMRRYQLRLKSDVPAADDGHSHGADEDETDHAHATRELVCNLTANVSALVVATPNFVSLGVVRPGEPIERTVKVETLDEAFALPSAPAHQFKSLSGGEFTGAEYFSVSVTPTEGSEGKSLDVTLRLDGLPDDYQGSFGGMVTLNIGHPTKPELNIRFSGVARPGIPPTSEDN